jgi:hypothetical protein
MVIGTARRRVDDPLPGENKLMRDYRRRSKSPQERTYSSPLTWATRRLNALIHNDDGYSTAVSDVLDDAIDLRDDAKRWKQDDIDKSLTVACPGCHPAHRRGGKGQDRARDDGDIDAT